LGRSKRAVSAPAAEFGGPPRMRVDVRGFGYSFEAELGRAVTAVDAFDTSFAAILI
jgi:hypothetical protein